MPSLITALGLYPIPVRKSSWPVLEVSMWPLNMRQRPLPAPSHLATTLARPSSTSCHVTSRPMDSQAVCMCSAIFTSSPVGLGMFMTSQHIATISSSRTSERILSISFALSLDAEPSFDLAKVFFLVASCQTKIVRISAQLFIACIGNQKVIFDAQAAAARPINSRLDRQHHPFFNGAFSRLMGIGKLVRPRAHAVTNGMGGLSWVSAVRNPRPNQTIKFGEVSAIPRKRNCLIEHVEQQIQQLVILGGKFAGACVLREVCPISIHTNPNFEQSGLIILNRTISGRCERGNPLARPDEGEGARHFHFPLVSHADAMHEAFVHSAHFAFFHAWAHVLASVIHSQGGQFIG